MAHALFVSRMHLSACGLLVASIGAVSASACAETNVTAPANFAAAHATVASWWPKAESVFISGDPKALDGLFTGSALDMAKGQMTIASLKGSRLKYPRPFRDSTVFGPSDPALTWFLAIIRYAPIDQDGRAQLGTMSAPGMIFTNNSGVWSVSAADVQAPIPHTVFGNGDSVLAGTAADSKYVMAASEVAGQYESYLTKLSAGQQPDVPFVTGLTSFAWRFARVEWPPSSIAKAQFSFVVDTPPPVSYSISDGGSTKGPEVLIFVIRRAVVLTPRQGCLVRRQNDLWSDVVPPGSYRSITLRSVSVIAATVPVNDGDNSHGRKVIDISGGIDDVNASGVKC